MWTLRTGIHLVHNYGLRYAHFQKKKANRHSIILWAVGGPNYNHSEETAESRANFPLRHTLKRSFPSADFHEARDAVFSIYRIIFQQDKNVEDIEKFPFICKRKVGLALYRFFAKITRDNTVVKVLCYKSEGHWFDPNWCQWIFH